MQNSLKTIWHYRQTCRALLFFPRWKKTIGILQGEMLASWSRKRKKIVPMNHLKVILILIKKRKNQQWIWKLMRRHLSQIVLGVPRMIWAQKLLILSNKTQRRRIRNLRLKFFSSNQKVSLIMWLTWYHSIPSFQKVPSRRPVFRNLWKAQSCQQEINNKYKKQSRKSTSFSLSKRA